MELHRWFLAAMTVWHIGRVGGFAFGALCALAIRHSGLEHQVNQAIEGKVSWTADQGFVPLPSSWNEDSGAHHTQLLSGHQAQLDRRLHVAPTDPLAQERHRRLPQRGHEALSASPSELAEAYPREKQSILALVAAGRLRLKRLNRPQDALQCYVMDGRFRVVYPVFDVWQPREPAAHSWLTFML
jgi:hypothetical protein